MPRSESVHDFLNKSNIQKKLVEEAFEREAKERSSSSNDKEAKDLRELSKKTGLSLETLKIIKAREGAFK